ncbi:NIPSNAP family protein [Mesorhizobium sp. M8A.F.Ca.ET.208.01.1.1]|uniref:NIPSNAP family protein n=1 Tax=unclassified Mesorhizobium TaxID=325217 RepID=UPI0010933B42|nr:MULTISPECIES: NIPSNAP family protein [unclassified Mesorhizobium]TGQ95616.1 NIPSNAP family protein [Mesorhizobium sp. M8A.F.Ca.ET.208.01.1.1]TGT56105.1 NIPSNAP family protein [Mesorhizobium sp. M8A.F.Ca.ET.167.01.1.1]
MNPTPNATPKPAALASPIVELRQYTLKPGRRETLIEIFDTEFIESQEDAGMTIIGQFRDLDRPDMFVWMRGFDSMDARKDALGAFYDGPVWAAHRDAANATMIDSDDVLLLRPAWPDAGFDLSGLRRPSAAKSTSDRNGLPGLVEISIHHLRPGTGADVAGRFRAEMVARLAQNGAPLLGAFVTEPAANTFPRLPVRAGENVFVAVTGFHDADAHANHSLAASSAWRALIQSMQAVSTKPAETLRLVPTARSLLR